MSCTKARLSAGFKLRREPPSSFPPCANLRSGNHKTAFVVKPAENLAFPPQNAWSQSQQPRPLVALMEVAWVSAGLTTKAVLWFPLRKFAQWRQGRMGPPSAELMKSLRVGAVQDILRSQLGRLSQDRSPLLLLALPFEAADRIGKVRL